MRRCGRKSLALAAAAPRRTSSRRIAIVPGCRCFPIERAGQEPSWRRGFSIPHVSSRSFPSGARRRMSSWSTRPAPAAARGVAILRGRWRLTPERLDRLVDVQGRLLDIGAELVRPGGRLVYAVCSLLSREGAGQIERFLNAIHRGLVRRRPSRADAWTDLGAF